MQRGAEEIGKMLNKGFDRQRMPTSQMAASQLDSASGVGLADLAGEQGSPAASTGASQLFGTSDANSAARQWMKDGLDDEMS